MNKLLISLLIAGCINAQAQVAPRKEHAFLSFFRFKERISPHGHLRNGAVLSFVPAGNSQQSFTYWQGSSYTSYSENGRLRNTYCFDVQGQLRESRTTFSLKKRGVLSYWHIQFSLHRTRPLFIYTIH